LEAARLDGRDRSDAAIINTKVRTNMTNKLHRLVAAAAIALGCVSASALAEAQECGPGNTIYAGHLYFSEPSTCSCGDGNVGFVKGLVMEAEDNLNFNLRYNLDASPAEGNFELTIEALVTYPDGHTDWADLGSVGAGDANSIFHSWHVDDGHIEEPWAFRATCRLYASPD
jgi:hypothetical protein